MIWSNGVPSTSYTKAYWSNLLNSALFLSSILTKLPIETKRRRESKGQKRLGHVFSPSLSRKGSRTGSGNKEQETYRRTEGCSCWGRSERAEEKARGEGTHFDMSTNHLRTPLSIVNPSLTRNKQNGEWITNWFKWKFSDKSNNYMSGKIQMYTYPYIITLYGIIFFFNLVQLILYYYALFKIS